MLPAVSVVALVSVPFEPPADVPTVAPVDDPPPVVVAPVPLAAAVFALVVLADEPDVVLAEPDVLDEPEVLVELVPVVEPALLEPEALVEPEAVLEVRALSEPSSAGAGSLVSVPHAAMIRLKGSTK